MDLATKEVINQKNRISASVEIFFIFTLFSNAIRKIIFLDVNLFSLIINNLKKYDKIYLKKYAEKFARIRN